MTTSASKLEVINFLLLKYIEAQQSTKALDADKTFKEWPATAGPPISARSVATRIKEISKDAVARGLVEENFSMRCSNYSPKKGEAAGPRQTTTATKKRARDDTGTDVREAILIDDALVGGNKGRDVSGPTASQPAIHFGFSPPSHSKHSLKPRSPSHTTHYRQDNKNSSRLNPALPAGGAASTAIIKGGTCHSPDLADNNNNNNNTAAAATSDSDSDSDSDSLADLDDTPTKSTKRARTLPTRQSRRGARKYYTEDDGDVGNREEESDDEFDPFRLREEARRREERMNRARRYARDEDGDEE